jgi:alkylation response protein AidB-like acyl-CoA dehydrogenase
MVVAWNEETESRDFFMVDRKTSPFDTSELDKLGWKGSPTGQLFFDDCRVPVGNSLTRAVMDAMEEGGAEAAPDFVTGGGDPLNAIFASMRNGMASIAVGIMQAAFDAAIEYATDRETFGKPIGGHQLVQEQLYDVKAALETSRQLTYHVDDLIAAGDPDARMMSSLAKGYACEKSVEAASDALQVHGANGLSTEYPLERYYRDARTMTIPDGTTEIQKLIVGYELTGEQAYT